MQKLIILLILLAAPGVAVAAPTVDAATSGKLFREQVEPLLKRYCVGCHGPKKQKSDFRVDTLSPNMAKGGDGDQWHEVANQLNQGDMPPDDEDQPTVAERDILVAWLAQETMRATAALRSTGGRNVMRRLTKYEYNNTLRDLLGIELDYAKNLPPEAEAAEGFVNNSSALQTSALHLSYFREMARNALRKAILFDKEAPAPVIQILQPESHKPYVKVKKTTPAALANTAKAKGRPSKLRIAPVGVPRENAKKEKDGSWTVDPAYLNYQKWNVSAAETGVILSSSPKQRSERSRTIDFSTPPASSELRLYTRAFQADGPARITIRAASTKPKASIPAHLEIVLGRYAGGTKQTRKLLAAVDISAETPRDYIFDFRIEEFPLEAGGRFSQLIKINNTYDLGTRETAVDSSPGIFIDYVRIEAPYYPQWPPESTRRILIPSKNKGNEATYVPEVLERFISRAFRQPATQDDLTWGTGLYRTLRGKGLSYEDALIETLAAVLSSPKFLLLLEPTPTGNNPEKTRRLDDFEIASRLSYFLWNTMPDDRLFSLATKKQLRSPKALAAETARMLEDPRSQAFFKNFTTQWLGMNDIYAVAINPEYFPKFDDKLKDVMKAETVAFLRELIMTDKSLMGLIDSDFAMLNGDMARHYGIANVDGNEFRPVKLSKADKRGGILTHAGLLTRNSSGDDSHPVKRGVWILEHLLNDPPPPAPAEVPPIDDAAEELPKNASLKEKLELHRQHESCMSCHKKIDPWGMVFEDFDGIGKLRTSKKIDTRTTLANGTKIAGLDELKRYLLTHKKDQFSETVSRRMLSFSLGRYLDFMDTEAVDKLHTEFKKSNYNGKALITAIVLSEPFLTK